MAPAGWLHLLTKVGDSQVPPCRGRGQGTGVITSGTVAATGRVRVRLLRGLGAPGGAWGWRGGGGKTPKVTAHLQRPERRTWAQHQASTPHTKARESAWHPDPGWASRGLEAVTGRASSRPQPRVPARRPRCGAGRGLAGPAQRGERSRERVQGASRAAGRPHPVQKRRLDPLSATSRSWFPTVRTLAPRPGGMRPGEFAQLPRHRQARVAMETPHLFPDLQPVLLPRMLHPHPTLQGGGAAEPHEGRARRTSFGGQPASPPRPPSDAP